VKHCSALIVAVSISLALAARAQEQGPLLPPQLREDPRERMKELVVQIERRLGEIDVLLYRAGSGETKLESQDESGIAQLLAQSRSSGQRVLDDIDEMLELSEQMGGSSKSSGSGQPSQQQGQQGQSPQQGSQRPQAQERTPQAPGEGPQQTQPQPGKEEQGKAESQPGESKPQGDRESNEPPRNAAGDAPSPSPQSKADGARSNEQWGDLPPTVRDLFRTEGGSDLPPQYRDWIDAYYRRLNQERR